MAGGAGDLFQGCPYRLGDQLQAGQVPHERQDVGGAGALGGAVADQPGLLQPGQGQVKKPVRPPVHQQPVAEIAQHAVVEARIVEAGAERVLEGRSGTAPPRRRHGQRDRAGTAARSPLPAGQARSRAARPGDTSRRSPRPPTSRRAGPAPASLPSRPGCRPAPPTRSAPGPRPPAGDESTSRTPQGSRGLISPQDWPRASLQSAEYQDSRQSQAIRRGTEYFPFAISRRPLSGEVLLISPVRELGAPQLFIWLWRRSPYRPR